MSNVEQKLIRMIETIDDYWKSKEADEAFCKTLELCTNWLTRMLEIFLISGGTILFFLPIIGICFSS